MKHFLILLMTCVVGLTVGFGIAPLRMSLTTTGPAVGHANWASQATTIPEVVAEADIIVRVHVNHVPKARKLKEWLPTDSPDKKLVAAIMPFTDTTMQVIEVYKGTVSKHVTVMQTGGQLPAADGDSAIHIETHDDPIFVQGSEHVLFLKDISGDAIHGKGRKLYRIVNPAGRYTIEDTRVFSLAEFPEGFRPPTTLTELVGQIRQALGS